MKLIRIGISKDRPLKQGEFTLDVRDNGTAVFVRRCPSGKKICPVFLILGPPDVEHQIHGWDGNEDAPTITPSIVCGEEPRCGHHYIVHDGDPHPF